MKNLIFLMDFYQDLQLVVSVILLMKLIYIIMKASLKNNKILLIIIIFIDFKKMADLIQVMY